MRAVFITRHGAPERLQVRDAPEPKAGPGQVRIRVRAAGINFADVLMRLGLYVGAPPPPFVPGYEVAGEVDEVGAGVKGFEEGAAVYTALPFGGYAELAVVPAAYVLPIPRGRSFEEAAALPVNFLTAYHALYVLGNLRPGGRVLVHAAAGGVGLAAIQLARLRGAQVFATASRSKHAFLKQQGVEASIDYRHEDFEARVRQLTGGRGVHVALDPIGGSSFRKSYRALSPTGMLVCYGIAASAGGARRNPLRAGWTFLSSGLFSPLSMMLENKGVAGFHLGLLDAETLAGEMAEIHRMWGQGEIRAHVGKTFPADRAADAHRYIQGRENVGKVVLTF